MGVSPYRREIRQIEEYIVLCRNIKTGIAWVENGKVGISHGPHPSIDVSGSLRGMRRRGWNDDRVVKSHGSYYNVDRMIMSDEFDFIAAAHCLCPSCRDRRENPSDFSLHANVFFALEDTNITGFGVIAKASSPADRCYMVNDLRMIRGDLEGSGRLIDGELWVAPQELWGNHIV